MFQALARLDDLVARVERGVVLVLLAVMSCTVFFDVLHRVASTPEGLVLKILCALTGRDRLDPTLRLAVPLILAFVFYWLFYGALKTATGSRFDTRPKLLLGALGLLAASTAGIYAVLTIFPNGLVWSQPLALSLLLWVALLGATLSTKSRGHIVLEVADRIWPGKLLNVARFVSGVLAALFCGAMVILGLHYASDSYGLWNEGRASGTPLGYVPGVPLPKWVVFASIPVTFALMSVRFLAIAVQDARGKTPPPAHLSIPGAPAEEVAP